MLLDVSDAFDIVNLDTICVIRQRETVTDKGRSSIVKKVYSDVAATVTAATDNDFKRQPDMDFSTKSIVIVTQFRLQMNSPGFKPDLVQWGSDYFLVVHIDDYSRYGPGFVQAIAKSTDYVDQPPSPGDCPC